MNPEDSTNLVDKARLGDQAAFATLIRLHERRLGGLLARLLDDPRDVEEALADTFVAA